MSVSSDLAERPTCADPNVPVSRLCHEQNGADGRTRSRQCVRPAQCSVPPRVLTAPVRPSLQWGCADEEDSVGGGAIAPRVGADGEPLHRQPHWSCSAVSRASRHWTTGRSPEVFHLCWRTACRQRLSGQFRQNGKLGLELGRHHRRSDSRCPHARLRRQYRFRHLRDESCS